MAINKECLKCGSNDFSTISCTKNDKIRYRCRPCHNRRNRMYNKADPEKSRQRRARHAASGKYRLRAVTRMYNITKEEYLLLVHKQNNCCAICLEPEKDVDKRSGMPRNLAVDHCHDTEKVRGLLCAKCNKGLGLFKHNVNYLLSAVKYLEELA